MGGEPAKRSKSSKNDAPPRRSASSASHKKTGNKDNGKRSSSRPRSSSDAERHGKSNGGGGDLKRSRSAHSHNQSKSKKAQDGKSNDYSKKESTKSKGSQKKAAPAKKKPVDNYGTKVASEAGNANKDAAQAMKLKKKVQKFAKDAQKAIPAQVRMISGSHDSQTSADVSNINSQFQLPNPAGKSGGACTASLLEVLYDIHDKGDDGKVSWVDVLREMRDILEDKGFDQVPQLTSSRLINVNDPFAITPSGFDSKKNTKRAVLIGINYVGQKGELSGCHNDVKNVTKYLTRTQGFKKENITILMDEGEHKQPTKSNIISAYKKLVKESKSGDVVFCHYSGHGGRLPDDNGDEDDGFDETLIPVDFQKSGQIRDDDLLNVLVHPMAKNVIMTCLMDCCHSGTVLDLPYRFTADGDVEEMEMNEDIDFAEGIYGGVITAAAAAVAAAKPEVPADMLIIGGGPNAIHEYSDTACCVIA